MIALHALLHVVLVATVLAYVARRVAVEGPRWLLASRAATTPTATTPSAPTAPASPRTVLILVELTMGWRVYRARPGLRYRTEVEIYGTCVGWCDYRHNVMQLPPGLSYDQCRTLLRALPDPPDPPPPPVLVDVAAWCAIPASDRVSMRAYAEAAEKRDGVFALVLKDQNGAAWVASLLTRHGLALRERSADGDVWGRP